MHDALGDRMKSNFENRTRYYLPRRTYTIIRLDGCHFHTYTRGLQKPFDKGLIEDFDSTIIAMLPEIQGAVFAYTQSDEVSILLTDFETPQTCAWFDGGLQKMCSVAASVMTAHFNKFRLMRHFDEERSAQWALRNQGFRGFSAPPAYSDKCLYECVPISINQLSMAYFDARVFTIPDRIEVMNYFIWRNNDCSRNSVSMVAQSLYSHKELQDKSTSDMHEMIHQKGKNWATDYTDGEKNGRIIVKEEYNEPIADISTSCYIPEKSVVRSRWIAKGAGKFTESKEKLLEMIPLYA